MMAIRPLLILILALLACQPVAQAAEASLRWDAKEDKIDASVEDQPLDKFLQLLSGATGWQIYVQPGSERTVSAKFKNTRSGEALKRLLGDLNFALLPGTNNQSKLLVFKTTMDAATQLVQDPKKPRKVNDELILTLKPGANAEEIARRLGGKIVGRVDALGLLRLKFADEAQANLAKDQLTQAKDVASVDANFYIDSPGDSERLPAGSNLPFSLNPTVRPDGKYLIVGLIDTSVQQLEAKYQGFLLNQISVAGIADPVTGEPTHGTSMAETILRGMALTAGDGNAAVRILPIDVYGNNATTTTFDVANGIYAAINNGASIINLSLGSSGDTPYLQTLIRNTSSQGIYYFAAAGNEPVATPTYPAAYPEVIAVTAGDKNGRIASYANYGTFVDVVAPGVSMVSFNGRTFAVSGTSAATAFAAGAAARTGVRTVVQSWSIKR